MRDYYCTIFYRGVDDGPPGRRHGEESTAVSLQYFEKLLIPMRQISKRFGSRIHDVQLFVLNLNCLR